MNDMTEQKRGRGRPRTGHALTDAERAKRYRARRKARGGITSSESAVIEELREQLKKAQARIQFLESELSLSVTINNEPGTWQVQERKGTNGRWQVYRRGLSKAEALREFDRLLEGYTDKKYTYRMISE
ncbi:hypothetical protein WDV76_15850 [Xenorhabdus griffiniae]|uniref:hypothetical protein n=1 Tax=Xenorhabdus griffiniae TaxID=351672 RepID=UPI002359F76B|nr:hypothetical protein [Xenorhabdus griffiniae]MDC9605603.1 hypothetical protein [Xenorhabdus griffiniae]